MQVPESTSDFNHGRKGARLELRANDFNLFNKLNLTNVDTGITDSTFGRANSVLGSRTVEVEAHFKF